MSKPTAPRKRRRVESYAEWAARIDSEVEAAARSMSPSTVGGESLPRISAALTLARKNIPPEDRAQAVALARKTLASVIQVLAVCMEMPADILSHDGIAPRLALTTDWLQTAIMILTGRRSGRAGLARPEYE